MTYRYRIAGRPGYLYRNGRWSAVLSSNSRVHWHTRSDCMQKDISDMIAATHESGTKRPASPLEHAQVHVTLYVTARRRRDADGLYGTLKGILDGLTHAGVIADDSLSVIGTPVLEVIEGAKEYSAMVEVMG